MNCIIVDDEPLGRRAIQLLMQEISSLTLVGEFGDAESASVFLLQNTVDLVFLDIRMPGINGIEFARSIQSDTLIIFTTAYVEYALDSYEVDAIDYLVKPVEKERFKKAVEKAQAYHALLGADSAKSSVETVSAEHIFVKSERRYYKIYFKDILFIEGLKDYIILQLKDQRVITKMTLKAIQEKLPVELFLRVNKSYIVNTEQIESFDSNDIFIDKYEIAIGNTYREQFFRKFLIN